VRRVALAVAVVLLAAACGSGAVGGSGGGGSGSADAQVTFTPDPLRAGSVSFTVTITNDTTKAVALTFSSGQRADVTLSKGGDTVYTWSAARSFTQEIGHVQVAAGGNEAFTLDDPDFAVPAGSYTLRATVTASNRFDLTASRDVTVRSS